MSGPHLHGLAPGQRGSEETSQRWRFDVPGIEPQTFRTVTGVLATVLIGRFVIMTPKT